MKPAPRITITPMQQAARDATRQVLADLAHDMASAAAIIIFIGSAVLLAIAYGAGA